MANCMKKVAGLLGVELGESFKLADDGGKYYNYYRLTEKNGIEASDDNVEWGVTMPLVLKWLLMGDSRIIKLQWKPSYNDAYYMPSIISIGKNIKLFWTGSEADESSYQQGLICRTEEEAIKLAEEMLDIARKRFAGDR